MSEGRPLLFLERGDKEPPPDSSCPQPPGQVSLLPQLRLQVSTRPQLQAQAILCPKPPSQDRSRPQPPPQVSPLPQPQAQVNLRPKPPVQDNPRPKTPPQASPRHQPTVQANPRPQPPPFFVFFALAAAWAGVEGLDCFKCGSINGSDPYCGDPFHHNHSAAYLASPCLAGWKGRQGAFPATHCVKLSGYFYKTGETMFVRGCTTDSGTLTVDTELGRQSHCGVFLYDDRLVVGCVEACNEFDGCNASFHLSASPYLILFLLLLLLLLLFVHLLTVRVGGSADL